MIYKAPQPRFFGMALLGMLMTSVAFFFTFYADNFSAIKFALSLSGLIVFGASTVYFLLLLAQRPQFINVPEAQFSSRPWLMGLRSAFGTNITAMQSGVATHEQDLYTAVIAKIAHEEGSDPAELRGDLNQFLGGHNDEYRSIFLQGIDELEKTIRRSRREKFGDKKGDVNRYFPIKTNLEIEPWKAYGY